MDEERQGHPFVVSRRSFIKGAGAGVAGAAVLGGAAESVLPEQAAEAKAAFEQQLADWKKKYEETLAKFTEQTKAARAEVMAAGGLFILGTERHESRRIDNQLRGRAGR